MFRVRCVCSSFDVDSNLEVTRFLIASGTFHHYKTVGLFSTESCSDNTTGVHGGSAAV